MSAGGMHNSHTKVFMYLCPTHIGWRNRVTIAFPQFSQHRYVILTGPVGLYVRDSKSLAVSTPDSITVNSDIVGGVFEALRLLACPTASEVVPFRGNFVEYEYLL